MCEPWLSTPQGTPDIPLTFALAAARQSRNPEPDSSWEAAKKIKWHMEITYKLARLRAALNVHKLEVDYKRRWFNDHRFNADEKNLLGSAPFRRTPLCPLRNLEDQGG
eukprot:jgi/Tetstr1/462274/TSEL_007292.t1